MNENINNRLAYNIYVSINFFLTISIIVFFIFFLIENISDKVYVTHLFTNYLIGLTILYIILKLFDLLIKSSYFEAEINYGQICIRSFNPNKKNGTRFFLMLFYKKYLLKHTINRQSYNNYRIEIKWLGFKKSLILQKTENGRIYESNAINISFLGAKKYTDLILSIDRIKENISLN